jgi:hypothetical protein
MGTEAEFEQENKTFLRTFNTFALAVFTGEVLLLLLVLVLLLVLLLLVLVLLLLLLLLVLVLLLLLLLLVLVLLLLLLLVLVLLLLLLLLVLVLLLLLLLLVLLLLLLLRLLYCTHHTVLTRHISMITGGAEDHSGIVQSDAIFPLELELVRFHRRSGELPARCWRSRHAATHGQGAARAEANQTSPGAPHDSRGAAKRLCVPRLHCALPLPALLRLSHLRSRDVQKQRPS